MKIQTYDRENYTSWEDAEKCGAIYTHYLTDDIAKKVPKKILEQLAGDITALVETCIRYDDNVVCRVVK